MVAFRQVISSLGFFTHKIKPIVLPCLLLGVCLRINVRAGVKEITWTTALGVSVLQRGTWCLKNTSQSIVPHCPFVSLMPFFLFKCLGQKFLLGNLSKLSRDVLHTYTYPPTPNARNRILSLSNMLLPEEPNLIRDNMESLHNSKRIIFAKVRSA